MHAPSSKALLASPAPRLAFVTIASRPSVRRDGGFLELILAKPKAEYFSLQGWTFVLPSARLICPTGTISLQHLDSRRHACRLRLTAGLILGERPERQRNQEGAQ